MNNDIHPGRLWQYVTTTPMHLGSQRWLKRQLPNMHGRHPAPAIGRSIIFHVVIQPLLGDHVRAGAAPLPWPTETVFVVAVGYCGDTSQA